MCRSQRASVCSFNSPVPMTFLHFIRLPARVVMLINIRVTPRTGPRDRIFRFRSPAALNRPCANNVAAPGRNTLSAHRSSTCRPYPTIRVEALASIPGRTPTPMTSPIGSRKLAAGVSPKNRSRRRCKISGPRRPQAHGRRPSAPARDRASGFTRNRRWVSASHCSNFGGASGQAT